MEKKVGNYITIFLLLLTTVVQASSPSIVLSIHDMDYQPLSQAMVNSQFVLQVVFNNMNVAHDMIIIPGIEQLNHRFDGRSSNISMYNGRSRNKIVYKFTIHINSPGVYSVGPVKYNDSSGKVIESNVLDIHVGDEIISAHQKSQNTPKEKYKITTQFDKQQVFIGEKVILKINFLDYVGIDQYSLRLPEVENLIITNVQEKKQVRTIDADNQEYFNTEWIVDCYPKKRGFIVAENITMRFVDVVQGDDFFGRAFFSNLALMMHAEKELRARPVGLKVVELPYNKNFQDIGAVGQFSKMEISVNTNSVEQGKGIVVKIDIFGNGNFEMIDSLPLILPQGLVSYDSHAPEIDKNRTYKHFEYIIQAQEPGQYQIPSQIFSYFDSVDQQYKTLKSDMLDILITAGIAHDQNDDQALLQDQDDDENNKKSILSYNVLGKESIHAPQTIIPLSWFKYLLKIIFLIFMFLIVYRSIIQKYLLNNKKLRRVILFFKAHQACRNAEKKGNTQALYSIFMTVFIGLGVGTLGSIDDTTIEDYFRNKGFSVEQITQWNIFYNKLLQASFSQENKKKNSLLYKEAYKWLNLLKMKV